MAAGDVGRVVCEFATRCNSTKVALTTQVSRYGFCPVRIVPKVADRHVALHTQQAADTPHDVIVVDVEW